MTERRWIALPDAPADQGVGRQILLSFDLEEFDLPLELGQQIDQTQQMRVGREGLEAVLAMLARAQVSATFFTTANFADHHRQLMQVVATNHEIASHGYWHSTFQEADLQRSRKTLEDIVGRPVRGFRRARFAETDRAAIERAGYSYNSSENPIWLPGRYNRFFKPRRPYLTGHLLNVPISASPVVRFPLFWLSFKNLPVAMMKPALSVTLAADKYLNIFFHPWEFADLSEFDLPHVVKRRYGQAMVERAELYLAWLKRRGQFVTFTQFDGWWRARQ